MSKQDYVYMAGLLDGEGTIGLNRGKVTEFRSPYVSVTSTTREIIDWLIETWTGSVCKHKVYQDHHKPAWEWRLRNKSLVFHMLEMTTPYMLEPMKKARIHMLLSEYESVTPRNGKYTDEMRARKNDFEERFLALR